MRKYILGCVAGLTAMAGLCSYAPADYVWESMSRDSSESMPVGGGDIGMNVWVEDGDLLFYICRSGAYDENSTLLKQGRVRVSLPGDSLAPFSQRLSLRDGHCEVNVGGNKVTLWADVFKPVVHVEIESPKGIVPHVSYENWRYADRLLRKGEGNQNSWKWTKPGKVATTRDSVRAEGNSVTFFHQNPGETVFDLTVSREGLDSVKNRLWNPLGYLRSGGRLKGDNLRFTGTTEGVYDGTDYRAWNFTGVRPSRRNSFTISLANAVTRDGSEWEETLSETEKAIKPAADRRRSRDWWRGFSDRSYIAAPAQGDTAVVRMTRNYELFRHMLGCNAYGKEPTKFNGGLFTFDPVKVTENHPFTPDYRSWGGGTMTAQNQRLVYWPMLKSGDADMMKTQFDFYNRMLGNATERVRAYWGHDGACFAEQTEHYGLPNMMEYGTKRPEGFDPGVEYNAWLEYEWDTVFEFCRMILDSREYTGADIREYEPLIEGSLRFFDEHYRWLARRRSRKELDGEGKLVLFPGSGCETYKMANNASSTVAALQNVTDAYIGYLESKGDTALSKWKALRQRVPEIPERTLDGHLMIAPARTWERINNIETPQLYPVFPWRLYGVATGDSAGLATARNTYLHDPDALRFRDTKGWKQDNIWAACLGLTDEAMNLNLKKWENGRHRFPAFFGPGFDWTPDHNWGGSAMIGLQEMLLQTNGRELHLFPAWDLKRDISFRLHAPGNTVVEAELRGGRLTRLDVTPAERRADVKLPPGL